MSVPIGILGGTFDPVHNGHLRMALEVLQQLNLSEVRLIPLNIPPHRLQPVATNKHRLHMLSKAVAGIDGLFIDEREINRDETSWTIDTVKSFRDDFPDRSLCLLMGEDAFVTLDSWRSWQKLTDYVHIIVASRNAMESENYPGPVKSFFKQREVTTTDPLDEQLCGCIYRALIPMLDISSTRIRRLITNGKNADFLLPRSVLDYINDNKLYR